MQNNNEIRNCKIEFRCPQKWDALFVTEDADIRYCGECKKMCIFVEP